MNGTSVAVSSKASVRDLCEQFHVKIASGSNGNTSKNGGEAPPPPLVPSHRAKENPEPPTRTATITPSAAAKPPKPLKPSIAPKPPNLRSNKTTALPSTSVEVATVDASGDRPPTPTSPKTSTSPPPMIFVSQAPSSSSLGLVATHEPSAPEDFQGVRSRAKMFENMGFVPRVPDPTSIPPQDSRPLSDVSTSSVASAGSYDFNCESSESDEESTVQMGSFGRPPKDRDWGTHDNGAPKERDPMDTIGRREGKSSVVMLHLNIISELKRLGVMRSSWAEKKEQPKEAPPPVPPPPDKKPSLEPAKRSQSMASTEIPQDVGRERENKGRKDTLLAVDSTLTFNSSDDGCRASLMSDEFSTASTLSFSELVHDYDTGDEEENKRLKKLHYAAVEFLTVQTAYVRYLREMTELYPTYLEHYGKQIGKDLLGPQAGQSKGIVQLIQNDLNEIVPYHKDLLAQIELVISDWDSQKPCMAQVVMMYAPYLKSCLQFLTHKSEFGLQLIALRNENKDFDSATDMFERKIFSSRTKGAVTQQLDQVHQNLMRYKILMMRYNEYLPEGSDELRRGQEVVDKLENITQTANERLGLPSSKEIYQLYDRFGGQFNLFALGRHLLKHGDVLKESRKELQPRYLVLFNDYLWMCRTTSSFVSSGLFDVARSYCMPIESVRTRTRSNDDYACHLTIISKVKSAVIVFESEKLRDQWKALIHEAHSTHIANRRRLSQANFRQDGRNRSVEDSTLPVLRPNSFGDESRNDVRIRSRSSTPTDVHSEDALSSVPVTPADGTESSKLGELFDRTTSSTLTSTSTQPAETVRHGRKKKRAALEIMKPVWLPDKSSNFCLMEGCDTRFSIIKRKHHCRNCGWLICKYCRGEAPLRKFEFNKELVCPECFEEIETAYLDGKLFPDNRLVKLGDGSFRLRIGKSGEQVVEPRTLFTPPHNRRLRKKNIRAKERDSLAFGKVYMRPRDDNAEVLRFAALTKDQVLMIYEAELDDEPAEKHLVHGFSVREEHLSSKEGYLFHVTHRNQIRSPTSKDRVIRFRVEPTSYKKWSSALFSILPTEASEGET